MHRDNFTTMELQFIPLTETYGVTGTLPCVQVAVWASSSVSGNSDTPHPCIPPFHAALLICVPDASRGHHLNLCRQHAGSEICWTLSCFTRQPTLTVNVKNKTWKNKHSNSLNPCLLKPMGGMLICPYYFFQGVTCQRSVLHDHFWTMQCDLSDTLGSFKWSLSFL